MPSLPVCASVLAVALASAAPLHAQNCGLASVTETTPLLYPPIARAAYVQGTIILMADFSREGKPETITPLSGPPMLRQRAIEFVHGWQVNPYGGPRACPIVIRFAIDVRTHPDAATERLDPQHVIIYTTSPPVFTTYQMSPRPR